MLTNLYKVALFISSFLPLYLILMVKFYDFNITLSENINDKTISFSIFLGLVIFSLITFLYFLFCEMNEETNFKSINNVNNEILTYFITYIVPLTTLEITNVNSIIINIMLFTVIGIFYVNSNQIYLNVLFTLFGFNVYKDSSNKIIISKKSADKLREKQNMKVKRVGRNIYIINKK